MVLLETGELLLHENSTTVVKVMGWSVFKILHALPTSHSHLFTFKLVSSIHEAEESKDHTKPERAILHEGHIAIVMHWVRRHGLVEVVLVTLHESLELNRVLRVDSLAVGMVEVKEVVSLG